MLAGVAGPVALVGRAGVAVVGTGRARRLLGVGRTRLAGGPAAGLADVALARGRPADGQGGEDDVRRAGGRDAGADLVRVAEIARPGAADRAGVPRRVLAVVV